MDTIHHLLRLNVEIEGALRVLTTGDNEIALRILDEKTRELSDIVRYLIHPEEDIEALSTNNRTSPTHKTESPDDRGVVTPAQKSRNSIVNVSPKVEDLLISKTNGDGNGEKNNVFDDPAETAAIYQAEAEDVKHRIVSPEVLHEEKPLEIIDGALHEPAPEKPADSVPQQETLKDKIRIDEMLSRREARDLSKAFKINDRFRFQLHIFGGSKEAFNTSIEAISLVRDYDSALDYLSGIIDIESEDPDILDFLAIIQNHFNVK